MLRFSIRSNYKFSNYALKGQKVQEQFWDEVPRNQKQNLGLFEDFPQSKVSQAFEFLMYLPSSPII